MHFRISTFFLQYVLFKMLLPHDGIVAVRALEGFLPSVLSDVNDQIEIGLECIVTFITLKWPLSNGTTNYNSNNRIGKFNNVQEHVRVRQ